MPNDGMPQDSDLPSPTEREDWTRHLRLIAVPYSEYGW